MSINIQENIYIYRQIKIKKKTIVARSMEADKAKSNAFTSEQKVWLKLHEEFRINSRDLVLYDSTAAMGTADFRADHNGNRVTVENKHDVKIYAADRFNFTLGNHNQWVANVIISSNAAKVNEIYRLVGNRVEMFHTTAVERKLVSNIRVELRGEGLLHRIDLRLPHSQWFSVFIFGRSIISVRTNGDYYAEKMQNLSRHVSLRTLEWHRTQKDLRFVIENNQAPNALIKCHASRESETQTEESEEKLSKADVKAAVKEAIESLHTPQQRVNHPWIECSNQANLMQKMEAPDQLGAQSLALQEVVEEKADEEISEWSYVYESKPNKTLVAIRKENAARFGGLFDVEDSDDGDDEKSRE